MMPTLTTQAKLLTAEEVAQRLGVDVSEVNVLVTTGKLSAYRLGGQFVRFRRDDVDALARGKRPRAALSRHAQPTAASGWGERIREFVYLHDFYLMAVLLTLLLIAVLIRFA